MINRSNRAIKCLYFNSEFYKKVKESGLSAENIFEEKEKYITNISWALKNSDSIEKSLLWLIKIGVLRREVDGQGLTSKVRVTPIGRQVLESNSDLFNQKATLIRKLIT